MEPTKELIDSIYVEKVLRARRQSGDEKLLDGARLFDMACVRMRDGIRHAYPSADAEEVERRLRNQLWRLRYVAEHAIYRPAGGGS